MFEIQPLTRSAETVALMASIGARCFGPHFNKQQLEDTWSSHPETTYFGVWIEGQLAAYNGFVAHPIMFCSQRGLAFQSCNSATDPQYRGRGLFQSLIEHAKIVLAEKGEFIIGFPNEQSGPIFRRRLGFEFVPLVRVLAPCNRIAKILFDKARYEARISCPETITFDQRTCASWKRRIRPEQILEFEQVQNYVWGFTSRKRVPLLGEVNLFEIGGCEIQNGDTVGKLFEILGEKAGATFARAVCSRNGAMAHANTWKMSGARTEPLIWYGLRKKETPQFEAYTGIKDVFGLV